MLLHILPDTSVNLVLLMKVIDCCL